MPTPSGRIAALARQPLVHFLLLGAAVYLAYGLLGAAPEGDGDDVVRVTAGQIRWLEESWEKRWSRPPTAAEREGLVNEYVRETILYREALAMGLDRDDTIVRRRLAQKLEFLSQDLLAPPAPGDEELAAFLAKRRARYRNPAVLTLTQVFVDPDRRGDATRADAEALLAELRGLPPDAPAVAQAGDPLLLRRDYTGRSETELGKLFGREFGAAVAALEPGAWHGPVPSGYGLHLVFVHERVKARDPELAEVRERVARDWQDERRRELNEAFYARLRERYTVIVESTDVAAAESAR